jgi:hypothetical protein
MVQSAASVPALTAGPLAEQSMNHSPSPVMLSWYVAPRVFGVLGQAGGQILVEHFLHVDGHGLLLGITRLGAHAPRWVRAAIRSLGIVVNIAGCAASRVAGQGRAEQGPSSR